jgi:taurine dioxygenase
MGIGWQPLAASFGAQVTGLDLSRPIQAEDAAALRRLWAQHGLLLFRGQKASHEQHLGLSRVFGELENHPAREAWVEGHPELTAIEYDPARRDNYAIYSVNGQELAGWLPWHIDLIYMQRIARAGCLRALRVPLVGGETGFIDRLSLYDTLPADLRKRSCGRRVLYRLNPNAADHPFMVTPNTHMVHQPARIAALAKRVDSDFPTVSHPVTFHHPDADHEVMNVSPMLSIGMQDMPREAGDRLLHELVAHTLHSPHRYFHHWQVDDILLWDNWRMLHTAGGVPVAHARQLYRASLAGDYGLGQLA